MRALLFLLLLTTAARAEELPREVSGPTVVIDGDSIIVASMEVRLIDAPEMRSGHGHFARAALERV